jgi:hypothetical protein
MIRRRIIAATREGWLHQLVQELRPLFKAAGAELPADIHVTCGWPTKRAIVPTGKSRTVGQCFSPAASAKGTTEICVSPAIGDAQAAAAILVHELCHAALIAEHPDEGHGSKFKRLALAIGLEGKMTETTAGPQLRDDLRWITSNMRPYPHSTLDVTVGQKKQSTRMLKVVCPECGYTVRTTATWIEQGLPTCPCATEMEIPDPDAQAEPERGRPLAEVLAE